MNKQELITKENVKTMGETIAVACARNRCALYYTEKTKKLYDELVRDVSHHNVILLKTILTDTILLWKR